jgi:hypothetical protein
LLSGQDDGSLGIYSGLTELFPAPVGPITLGGIERYLPKQEEKTHTMILSCLETSGGIADREVMITNVRNSKSSAGVQQLVNMPNTTCGQPSAATVESTEPTGTRRAPNVAVIQRVQGQAGAECWNFDNCIGGTYMLLSADSTFCGAHLFGVTLVIGLAQMAQFGRLCITLSLRLYSIFPYLDQGSPMENANGRCQPVYRGPDLKSEALFTNSHFTASTTDF